MKDWATGGDTTKLPWNSGGGGSGSHHALVRKVMHISLFIVGFAFLWMFLYNSASPLGFPVISNYFNAVLPPSKGEYDPKLEKVLRSASMENKTVILTTLNDAWAEPGSIFDLFLESFKVGKHTEKFLRHLVVITWDEKAHARCTQVHPHCYRLETGDNFTSEAFFMTPRYLQMMWKRIDFLRTVLEMGYSFVFTDTDIMWFRDPFKRFHEEADFQIACDFFQGNSYDMKNLPNGGFNYVKSNNRTIWFYRFWYNSRTVYPKLHDQDVLNKIKWHPFISNVGLKIRFLSTDYYGGFCQPSKDFNEVCTMHANCCIGLDNKIIDLKIMLGDWKNYMALPQDQRETSRPSWSVPQSCR
ncbi:nucleotide-diphospho-sugar transferase family protein [Senna tora]|uniref:Nucleotide-diphospho-sugar transferase family protein n=1 Tax=Senna tora TaxID=362788 RepID=A0A834T391_9FABA|nr:nucleotide-diphospho-sugar transferase family protein [Senna tora]